jgi:hypothetical protein
MTSSALTSFRVSSPGLLQVRGSLERAPFFLPFTGPHFYEKIDKHVIDSTSESNNLIYKKYNMNDRGEKVWMLIQEQKRQYLLL